MKKDEVWDQEINPDLISEPLENLNSTVWDRGYVKETDDGIWYEVYVTDNIKQNVPKIDLNNQKLKIIKTFHDLLIDHYENDNQITFFAPINENQNYLDILTNVFVQFDLVTSPHEARDLKQLFLILRIVYFP